MSDTNDMLAKADLADEASRLVLADALEEDGFPSSAAALRANAWFAAGYEDGSYAASESGGDDTPDGGWDSWAINGIGTRDFAKQLGLAEDMDAMAAADDDDETPDYREHPAWQAACCEYHRGACEGATDHVEGMSEG